MEVQDVRDSGDGKYGASWDGGLEAHPHSFSTIGAPKGTTKSTLTPSFKKVKKVKVLVAQSYPVFYDPMDGSPTRLLCPWDSPGKNTWVGSHFLLQGIFLTQGLNLGLLHCRQTLYCLNHQESPLIISSRNLIQTSICRQENRHKGQVTSSYLTDVSGSKDGPNLGFKEQIGFLPLGPLASFAAAGSSS